MLIKIPGFQWTPYELEIIKKNQKEFNKLTEFSQIFELSDKLVSGMDGEHYGTVVEFAMKPIAFFC